MLCERCGQNNASVHVTRIVNGERSEINVCANCAAEMPNAMPLSLQHLFAGIMEEASTQRRARPQRRCETCGLTFEQFRESGRLGCSHCYEVFREELTPILKRVHGSTEYMGYMSRRLLDTLAGAAPTSANGGQSPLAEMKKQMALAVEREDFEEAARLRDAIREAESAPSGKGEA